VAERRRSPRRRGRRGNVRSRSGSLVRRLLSGGLVVITLATVTLAGYLFYLDRKITSTFEGRRWTVPAIIYAQPLELYPGAAQSVADVTRELDRLGYRARSDVRAPGTYQRAGARLDIHLRAFRFMERQRESQRIELAFSAGAISDVRDATGRPVPLVRLEPLTIGSFFPSHGEDRLVLPPEQIPPLLRDALKAVEDQNFDRHAGFDPIGIARALWVNLRAGEIQQGGSTLTQQLVKSYYLDNRRTFERKLREVAMAVILDARFDKQEILDAYINEIYLGQDGARSVHGFGLGAQYYFNQPLTELDVHEIATLIAVIRGPSYYNPYRHPQRVRDRRDLVLDKMLESQLIDPDTHAKNRALPLEIVQGPRTGGAYHPAFLDLVRAELAAEYQDDQLTSNGLRIFTTLRPSMQDAVELSLSDTLTRLERDRELPEQTLQGAAVVVATQTGEALAVAGGRTAGFHGFNRALDARRPIGSLIKPVIYLAALEQGRHLASIVDDSPVRLEEHGRTWAPRNFDNEVHGPVPLVRALGDSLNLASVHLGLALGVDRVADRLAALTGVAASNRFPSLLLGAEPMSPLQVATLYGVFASGGFYTPTRSVIAVLDEAGAPLTRHSLEVERRVPADVAAALNYALVAVMRHGTGATSRFARMDVAGKTGTSDDYRDSWFVGFDDAHLGVVWVGADDNSPTSLTGATGAMRVWDDIFTRVGVTPLLLPESDLIRTIEYDTGLLAHDGCAAVTAVPLPEDAALQSKPGCGINLRSLGDRLRSWLGTRNER
jgi:penicillin-binding protein 1B